jgi:hypothetical protein
MAASFNVPTIAFSFNISQLAAVMAGINAGFGLKFN